ncbi:unnamed protein product [Brugia pahangi]|uniref:Uncharacterized protein n=1 Tax=Brugia pahangi TaxID=6280 RepID=A0A0N4TFE2_BRUPA|nr:unnamed protein product [Brugia pahangi]
MTNTTLPMYQCTEEYLPWLLYENEISCIRVTFDVCERVPKRSPFTGQLTCF